MYSSTEVPVKTQSIRDLRTNLKLVKVVTERRHSNLDVLALAYHQCQFLHLALFHAIAWHVVPMVEDALWERLPTCLLAQGGDKTKRFGDWKVCPRLHQRSSLTLILFEHATSAHVHA